MRRFHNALSAAQQTTPSWDGMLKLISNLILDAEGNFHIFTVFSWRVCKETVFNNGEVWGKLLTKGQCLCSISYSHYLLLSILLLPVLKSSMFHAFTSLWQIPIILPCLACVSEQICAHHRLSCSGYWTISNLRISTELVFIYVTHTYTINCKSFGYIHF